MVWIDEFLHLLSHSEHFWLFELVKIIWKRWVEEYWFYFLIIFLFFAWNNTCVYPAIFLWFTWTIMLERLIRTCQFIFIFFLEFKSPLLSRFLSWRTACFLLVSWKLILRIGRLIFLKSYSFCEFIFLFYQINLAIPAIQFIHWRSTIFCIVYWIAEYWLSFRRSQLFLSLK